MLAGRFRGRGPIRAAHQLATWAKRVGRVKLSSGATIQLAEYERKLKQCQLVAK